MRARPRVLMGLATVCALMVAGVAYATIPNAGVISACYSKSGGALRVIDKTVTNCKPTQTSLDRDQRGQPGPQGPVGPQGSAGSTGPQGPQT